MRVAGLALHIACLACASSVAFSQQQRVDAVLQLRIPAGGETPPAIRAIPEITASFSYTRQSHQELVIRELVGRMELHEELQRSVDLKTLNESPLSTVLNLSRFLTSRGYKRADGSPLIDLSF